METALFVCKFICSYNSLRRIRILSRKEDYSRIYQKYTELINYKVHIKGTYMQYVKQDGIILIYYSVVGNTLIIMLDKCVFYVLFFPQNYCVA
jgi:hypothetical protein